ncbi:MAG: cyclic nucleotide-binding domain-containing protein [Elusimicrobia bacterium]|nr:cyclic nucleotide-binding domain-containing protein [Elusimicrobiota bacterium]
MDSPLAFLRRYFRDKSFSSRREFLKDLPLCEGLSERELGYFQLSFHNRVYNEGETLFLEGDIGRALFVLESGKVELTKHGPDGAPQRIAELGPGALFGEMALLEQLPRSASAVALETSTLLLLYRSKLDDILHYHPRIGVAVMRHLARLLSARLRRVSNQTAVSAIP